MIEKINKWLPLVTFVALVALVLVGGNQSAMLGGALTMIQLMLQMAILLMAQLSLMGLVMLLVV